MVWSTGSQTQGTGFKSRSGQKFSDFFRSQIGSECKRIFLAVMRKRCRGSFFFIMYLYVLLFQEKPKPGEQGAFDEIAASFKQPESLGVMDFMIQVIW